jgi:hypothetical protein
LKVQFLGSVDLTFFPTPAEVKNWIIGELITKFVYFSDIEMLPAE